MEANNMAEMREALDRIGNIALFVAENCGNQQTAKYMTDIIMDVQSAVSAAPRNCDRFSNADEAIGAYRQMHKNMVVNVFLDWLFAPTTERKGERE